MISFYMNHKFQNSLLLNGWILSILLIIVRFFIRIFINNSSFLIALIWRNLTQNMILVIILLNFGLKFQLLVIYLCLIINRFMIFHFVVIIKELFFINNFGIICIYRCLMISMWLITNIFLMIHIRLIINTWLIVKRLLIDIIFVHRNNLLYSSLNTSILWRYVHVPETHVQTCRNYHIALHSFLIWFNSKRFKMILILIRHLLSSIGRRSNSNLRSINFIDNFVRITFAFILFLFLYFWYFVILLWYFIIIHIVLFTILHIRIKILSCWIILIQLRRFQITPIFLCSIVPLIILFIIRIISIPPPQRTDTSKMILFYLASAFAFFSWNSVPCWRSDSMFIVRIGCYFVDCFREQMDIIVPVDVGFEFGTKCRFDFTLCSSVAWVDIQWHSISTDC